MNCPNCHTHVDEHPANRCLDAWVAEFVLGYHRELTPKDANGEHGGDEFLVPPGGVPRDYQLPRVGKIGLAFMTPQSSTQWWSTLKLFTRMQMALICGSKNGKPGFFAGRASDDRLTDPDNPLAAFSKDEMLAICKAAIKIQAAQLRDER